MLLNYLCHFMIAPGTLQKKKTNNKIISQELKYYTVSCEIMSGRNKEVMKFGLRNIIVLKIITKMPA